MAEISIILIAGCADKDINITIQNILEQSFRGFEIIIVKYGTSSKAEETIKSRNKRIIQIKRPFKTYEEAINYGLRSAKNKFITFVKAQDSWQADKLALQREFLLKNPQTCLVYCDTTLIDKHGDITGNYLSRYIARQGQVFTALIRTKFVTLSSVMFRKECLSNLGSFNSRFSPASDYDFLLRFARHYKFGFIPLSLVKTKENDVNDIEEKTSALLMHLKIFLNLKKKYSQLNEDFRKVINISIYDCHQALAKNYILSKQYSLSARHYHKALGLNPGSVKLKEKLTIAIYLTGQVSKAKRMIKKRLQENPFHFVMHYYLGCCYFKENNWEKANKHFLTAIKSLVIYIYLPEALNNLALTYIALGDFNNASHCLWNAITQRPDYGDAVHNQKKSQEKVPDIDKYKFTIKLFGELDDTRFSQSNI